MKTYHIVYRTHNLINGKEYTGKHSTDDLDDGYYGSGVALHNAVSKYGLENFAVEILSFHDSEEAALNEEARIVDEEYVEREDTYNQTLGGDGGWFHTRGMVTVRDRDGLVFNVSVDDSRYLSGELVHRNIGEVTVFDYNKNTFNVSINDPKYLSGELKHISKGTVTVLDNGKIRKIRINDPRYVSGELKHICVGTVSVKDPNGNGFRVSKDDPRLKTGELVGVSKGMHYPNRKFIEKECPHCGKIGKGPNMSRYHFNNCKSAKI